MNKFIIIITLFIVATYYSFSKIDDSQFVLVNEKYGTDYNLGAIASDGNGTIYFVSGESAVTSYKQIYSLKDGIFKKELDISQFRAISDTIYNQINGLFFNEGKLYITANPHLFVYDFSNLTKITPDLEPNYLRTILDVESKNGVLYSLIRDDKIVSITPPNVKTVIPYDKILEYDGNNLKYYDIGDSVIIDSVNSATGIALDKNNKIWITFTSMPKYGGGLASFDGKKFETIDLEYYNEYETYFRASDIQFFDDKLYISFSITNVVDKNADGIGGFISYDFDNWKFFDRSKMNESSTVDVNDFIIIDEQNIWLACRHDLVHINSQQDEITLYKISDIFGLPTNDFNSINDIEYDVSTNTLWLSTIYSGLAYIKNAKTDIDDLNSSDNISFYPNPVKDKLTINLSSFVSYSDLSIALCNAEGKQIDKIENAYFSNSFQYDFSNLPAGVYFIVIDTPTKRTYKKVIKD